VTIPFYLKRRAEVEGVNLSEILTQRLRERYPDETLAFEEMEKLEAQVRDRKERHARDGAEINELEARLEIAHDIVKNLQERGQVRKRLVDELVKRFARRDEHGRTLPDAMHLQWIETRAIDVGLGDVPPDQILDEARRRKVSS